MVTKIAIANQKGGVGKTDLCVNLSTSLANKGKKVLLVDVDPQANATDYLTPEKAEKTIYNLLVSDETHINDTIQKTAVKNLDLIPSDSRLSAAQIMLAHSVGMQFKLKKKLMDLQGYDYVIIDTPPSLGMLTLNAMTAADKVLVPIQVHYFAMDGVVNLSKTIEAVKEDLNKNLKLSGVILTMYDKRNKLSAEVKKMVKTSFKDKLYKTVIPINVKLAEAPSHHKPIMHYASSSTGAKAYEKLVEEFLNNERR